MSQDTTSETDSSLRLNIIAHALLVGPTELLVPLSEQNGGGQLHPLTRATAREYFLGQALAVAQRAGWIAQSAVELEREIQQAPPEKLKSRGFNSRLAAHADQHAVWQRKLTEALAALIAFGSTNEQRYYYHRLRIDQLRALQSQQDEQLTFFGSLNAVRGRQLKALLKEIRALEVSSGISLAEAWYLDESGKDKRRPATAHAVLKHALAEATPREKQALGYVYEFAISQPSEAMHFSPTIEPPESELVRLKFGWARVFLIGLAMLNRAQQLLNVFPETSWCKHARNNNAKPHELFLSKRAVVGDFVAVEFENRLYLGEVLDIRVTEYQYESYRVRYLDEKPLGVIEDWVVKGMATPLPRADLIATMRLQHPDTFAEFPAEQIDDACRTAVAHAWRLGLRAHSERQVAEARRQMMQGQEVP